MIAANLAEDFRSSMTIIDQIPSDIFFTKHLKFRYRNTLNIQKLTKFIGEQMGITTEEEHVPPITGDIPVWIDLGDCNDVNIFKANLKSLLEMSKHFNEQSRILLYEEYNKFGQILVMHNEFGNIYNYIENDLNHLNKQHAEHFRGNEMDSVIYVGGGSLEAFSRAKHWLGIITYYDKSKHNLFPHGTSDWSEKFYRKCLSLAVERGLLRKLETTKVTYMDFKPNFLKGKRF